ncbi:MAG: hypothetical protein MJ066_00315 [Clostridia bacterium]|nr:hypothetical protein [Clostridia bacterium]
MCCFFNNNCPRRAISPRFIVGPMGPRGPIGPQGPVGPQGPQGAPASFNSVYAGTNATTTVATNSAIPLSLITSTPNNPFVVANNTITLPTAGTYLVSFFSNGYVATGIFDTTLYLNGTALPNETISQANTGGENIAGSKTILVNTSAPATLSLYNTSADTATISSASITVSKIA